MSFADAFVHLAARVAIQVFPPLTAKKWVEQVASPLQPLDAETATTLAQRLRRGTCLSRAITVATRLPDSYVVIGARGLPGEATVAHAWVEHGSTRIGESEGASEVARFR